MLTPSMFDVSVTMTIMEEAQFLGDCCVYLCICVALVYAIYAICDMRLTLEIILGAKECLMVLLGFRFTLFQ